MLNTLKTEVIFSNENNNWRLDAENKAMSLIRKTEEHIFIVQLIEGSLPKEIFKKYIIQDIIYCKLYQYCLYVLSQRMSEEEDKLFFLKKSENTKATIDYLKNEYKVDESNEKYLQLCKEYSMFEKDSVLNQSIEMALGSLLPCFYVYNEIGKYIRKQKIVKNNIYSKFMQDAFKESKSLDVYFEICERYSKRSKDGYKGMMESFLKSVEYEYHFFDSCYNFKKIN